ncbi:hypothetical protein KDA11_04970 [Candidatus Saccharibacteria bacterium]|nr:hypothetical protein [Candidatus Saccharibacteria bacterium]
MSATNCLKCNGTGYVEETVTVTEDCGECNGHGKVIDNDPLTTSATKKCPGGCSSGKKSKTVTVRRVCSH